MKKLIKVTVGVILLLALISSAMVGVIMYQTPNNIEEAKAKLEKADYDLFIEGNFIGATKSGKLQLNAIYFEKKENRDNYYDEYKEFQQAIADKAEELYNVAKESAEDSGSAMLEGLVEDLREEYELASQMAAVRKIGNWVISGTTEAKIDFILF